MEFPVAMIFWQRRVVGPPSFPAPTLQLESPFKFTASPKLRLAFMALNVIGALANRSLGSASFYFVSMSGGQISSASAIASAATLMAQKEIAVETGVNGVILSTVTSILANVPLIRSLMRPAAMSRRICADQFVVAAVGLAGMAINYAVDRFWPGLFDGV